MVYFDDFAPYSWRDEEGKMRGLMVDVMDRVGLELGVQVRHEGYPWLRAQKLVRAGQADGFVTVPTRERRAYTRVVEAPVAFSPLTLFTQTGHPALARLNQARALSDLKAFTILDYIGNGWGKENLVGFKVHLTSNVDNVFKLLAAGRGDLMITDPLVARFKLAQLGLAGTITEVPLQLELTPLHLCIANSSPFAARVDELTRILARLRQSGELARMEARYR
ncbi:substrate-binding periplasmic protein [Aeromonas dhakensis]|uniref:substrate-binding periplasmic protein n=1 Tax=Aeromonas dhakensis TaxID=196024 RepID=UPI001FCC0D42|nr:transporter substrate-binding domain-containing protein [Aeromonas dhakensis]MCJ2367026.1 transporter substrate-binding domain-containing protein [Aeromonas dhakensis]